MPQDFAKDLTKGQVFISFLKLLKFDAYMFVQSIAIVMQGVTITQLAEDKMCINRLHFPQEYCLTLTSNHSSESSTQSILVHANKIKNWQTAIETIPSTIIVVFLSYWLQNYPHYLKTLMMIPCFGCIAQNLIFLTNAFFFKVSSWAILLAYLPTGFSGGITLLFASFTTYVSWSTPTRFLVVRFAVFEMVSKLGILTGTYAGGHILAMKPWFSGQPENYLGVLLVSLSLMLIALVLGFCVHLEGVPETAAHLASRSHGQIAKDVFQLSRIKELSKPLTAKRSGTNRAKLLFLLAAGLTAFCIMSGDESIGFQFTQQVYGWSAAKYTSFTTLTNVLPAILTVIAPQILKLFNLRDSTIGVIGVLSMMSLNAIKGLITNQSGFIMAYTFGGLSTLANIANRALISQIIEPEETAKVFAITASLNSYASIASAYIYTSVFSLTISSRPGLIYNCATICLLFPMVTFLASNISTLMHHSSKPKSSPPRPSPPTINSSSDINGNPVVLKLEVVEPSI